MLFTLPVPPSTNNLFATGNGGSRFPTLKYWNWQHEADMEILAQRSGQPKIVGPVHISITVPFSGGKSDLDNRIKAVNDALVRMGIIEDDNDAVVAQITVRAAQCAKCTVEVLPLTAAIPLLGKVS